MGVVALGITTHHSLALLVPTRALPTRALQSTTTIIAIWRSLVCWTVTRIAGTNFLRVATTAA